MVLLVGLALLGVQAAASDDGVCNGKLGFPLGTYLRIEGVRAEEGKGAPSILMVDTVNGKKLDTPIGIRIEKLDSLPRGPRCILRGYETGKMVGVPPAVIEAAKEEGKDVTVPQVDWYFYRSFVVLSIVEPKDLKTK